jgi:hypothetical protein
MRACERALSGSNTSRDVHQPLCALALTAELNAEVYVLFLAIKWKIKDSGLCQQDNKCFEVVEINGQ